MEIYFDNSATTKPYDEVISYMNNIYLNCYGNPSSLHTKGIEAEKLIKKAREEISSSLNVKPSEILFTSGGTESNNLGILGYLNANPRKGKHIITTMIEHPSVLEVYKNLEKIGYEVDYISVNTNGIIDIREITEKIRKDTSLISIIYVNNETGAIQPIEEIAQIKNKINNSACLHVDAVQAFGKISINPKKIGIDIMSISSHKIHGPKGIGAIYVNTGIKIKPILFGGGQESNLRAGTENVPGICGFGKACSIIFTKIKQNFTMVDALKSLFLEKLKDSSLNYKIISSDTALPFIVNISFENIQAEVLLHHLEEKNIFVSSGAACSSRKKTHSHVLKAMGVESNYIEGSVRFSFCGTNNENEIFLTIEALKSIVPKISTKNGGKQ